MGLVVGPEDIMIQEFLTRSDASESIKLRCSSSGGNGLRHPIADISAMSHHRR
jgi:hypothetical protein